MTSPQFPRKERRQPMLDREELERLAVRIARWIVKKSVESFDARTVHQSLRRGEGGGGYVLAKDIREALRILQRSHVVERFSRSVCGRGRQPTPGYKVSSYHLKHYLSNLAGQL